MARGRMISNSLSTSEKFAALVTIAPDLFEFCHALYPLMVSHTDDFGRLQGDAFTVKAKYYPASPRPLAEFEAGLKHMHGVGLVVWYMVAGKRYIQIVEFERHQQGLHKRTRSQFPRVPGTSGKDEEVPGQEKGREGNSIEGKGTKEPPNPLSAKGGRVTRADRKAAKDVRAKRFGRCHHEPTCADGATCEALIAQELADRRIAS